MNKSSKTGDAEQLGGGRTNLLVEKRDFVNIAILTAVILAIGIYSICTTVLISRDGTLYINCAKQFVGSNFIEAVRTMRALPGQSYPIYLMHKTVSLLSETDSLQRWIVSAQAVSLISKLIASAALYFVGSYFAGRKAAFWSIIILSVLPDSVEYGSDAIPEWPQLMFLATGFLLLLWGTQQQKIWMFGLAGIAAGLGYLVRSESCQLVIYGGAWLIFNLIRPVEKMRRTKAVGALILLTTCFAIIATPYMMLKGYVFPDQRRIKLPAMLSVNNNCNSGKQDCLPPLRCHLGSATPNIKLGANYHNMCTAGIPLIGVKGDKTLTKNICETLMYYFVPCLLIGCWYYFRKQPKTTEQTFYAAAFIALNIAIPLWQMSYRHFLSRRHTLALVAFTVFYIPIGIEIIAEWISKRTSKNRFIDLTQDRQRWFYILLFIGIAICLPKLFKLVGTEKHGYRDAAMWLSKNTVPADIIAVPDKRITFYAERNGLEYSVKRRISKQAGYIVRVTKETEESPEASINNMEAKYSTWADKKGSKKLVIYKVIR